MARLRRAGPATPAGLGGWLIVLALILLASAWRTAHALKTVLLPLWADGSWAALTTAGAPAYHPLWAPLLLAEAVGNGVSILLALGTGVLLLRRSRHTPALGITWLVWSLVFVLADRAIAGLIPAVAARSDPEGLKDIARAAIAAAIWIPYLRRSRRARATFVA